MSSPPASEINYLSFIDECSHENINEGFCCSCGLSMGPRIEIDLANSDNHLSYIRYDNKKYESDITKLDYISDELKSVVITNLEKEKLRGKEASRNLKVFCHVYVNGAEMEELQPNKLVNSLNINSKNLNKSLRVISGTSRKTIKDNDGQISTCPIVSINPIDCLKEMCEQMSSKNKSKEKKIGSYHDEMKEKLQQIIKKSPSILNERPTHVAAGLIKYFCQIKNIDVKDMSSIINLSGPTLTQYAGKIKKLCEHHGISIESEDD